MEGIDIFKDRQISIDAAKLVSAATAASGVATAWVPNAAARIREGAILKARLVDHLDWETISRLPDVQMSIAGCQKAFYRCVNRFATAKDIPAFINSHLRRYEMYREMSINRAIDKPEETHNAVRSALLVDKREARLLGLDQPERVEYSGASGRPVRFESSTPINTNLIERVQELEIEEGEFLPSPPPSPDAGASGDMHADDLAGYASESPEPSSTSPAPDATEPLHSNILPLRPAPSQEAATAAATAVPEQPTKATNGRIKVQRPDYDNI